VKCELKYNLITFEFDYDNEACNNIRSWCKNNIKDHWSCHVVGIYMYFVFDCKEDGALFKLVWM